MFLEKIVSSKSNTFIFLLGVFLAGIFLASLINLRRANLSLILATIVIESVFLFLIWREKQRRLIMAGAFFLFLGAARFILSEPAFNPSQLIFYHDRYVEIQGTIIKEPATDGQHQQLTVAVSDLSLPNNEKSRAVKGRVSLSLPLFPEFFYGNRLRVGCQLAWADYLAREGIWAICLMPQILSQQAGGGNIFYRAILSAKDFLVAQVNRLLPEPQASFLGGLLYGARQNIPVDLRLAFNRTGTAHIVAISGYNITIIVGALLAILRGILVPRRQSFWLVVVGIIIFVILTGASAAVVRAGVMGLVVLLAKQVGRLSQAGRVLLLTAFLMALFNPPLLYFDLGFQLSFASTTGLVYLSPLLEKIFTRLPESFGLKESFLTTMAAILVTTPLLLHSFGRFSLVAPLTNLLILPAVPLTMALGFIAIVAGALFFPLGQFVAWLAWLPLTYIIKTVEFLSSWKYAALTVPTLPGWAMAALYGVMIYFIQRNTCPKK